MRKSPIPSLRSVLIICAALLGPAGCQALDTSEKPKYETVHADPRRDTKAAIKHHREALKIIDRASNPAYFQCECVAKALCNLHKAEQHLQQALVADVRYGPAHNTLGMLYYYDHKLYLAAWEFQYAARLMPERPEPINNLGMVYEGAERLGRAIEYYEQAVELAPTNPVFLGNLARAHLRQGAELDEVRGLLQEMLFYDSRPEWIAWARDLMGIHPLKPQADEVTGPEIVDPLPGTPANPTEDVPPPLSPTLMEIGAPELN